MLATNPTMLFNYLRPTKRRSVNSRASYFVSCLPSHPGLRLWVEPCSPYGFGFWVRSGVRCASSGKLINRSSSKDSVVHIWDIPGPDKDGVTSTRIEPPLVCAYAAKGSDSDLTSLTWSHDGSLVAVGCYDSVLRICDSKGKAYFTHTQHDVGRFYYSRVQIALLTTD